jgi:phosphonate transport system ATP-binding protein
LPRHRRALDWASARADQPGGQQQRVAIARPGPGRQGLADEASARSRSSATVLESLRRPPGRRGRRASLHQVHLAMQYADRIIALRGGTVIEDAPTVSFDRRALEQIYERAAPRQTEKPLADDGAPGLARPAGPTDRATPPPGGRRSRSRGSARSS